MFRWSSIHRRYGIIWALVAIVFFVLPDVTYAQESTVVNDIGEYVDIWIKLLSWIWVVPASIAGKLMTNGFVYGGLFHMDVYLWKIRIIMRTFAFFTLWFIFVVLLIKHIIKNDGPSKMWWLLGKVALAGILIPSTWFIIAAVIDISTVAVSAVAAFPQEILKDQWDSLKNSVSTQEVYFVDSLDGDPLWSTSVPSEKKLDLIDILPHADNVAGPLIFMWAAILKLMDTNNIADDKWTSSITTVKQLTINSIIKIIALLIFVVPLVVLMIINMIRIFWIWIWIIFSPFIVLDQVFHWPLSSNDKIGKNFKLSNILWLIFQPVAIVGLISIGLVLLIWVRDMLNGGGEYDRWMLEDKLSICVGKDGTNSSTFWCNTDIAEVIVIGWVFQWLGSRVWGFVGETILLLFTVFLLGALLKAWITMSEITKNVAESIYKFSEGMIKTIPVPGTSLSWASWAKAADKISQDNLWFSKKQREQSYKLNQYTDRFLGIDTGNDIGQDGRERIIAAMRKGGDYKGMAKNFWSEIHAVSQADKLPIVYNTRLQEIVWDRFSLGQGKKFLEEHGVITKDEAKKTDAEIMKLPQFLAFVDKTLTNSGTIGTTQWIKAGGVSTLDGKSRWYSK